jgi:hypothetical protein
LGTHPAIVRLRPATAAAIFIDPAACPPACPIVRDVR